MNSFKPVFLTTLHKAAAGCVTSFFLNANVDTELVVNSCARGQAVAESDLDLAVLVNEATLDADITEPNRQWQQYSTTDPVIQAYKRSSPFSHYHMDIIYGIFIPSTIENGEPIDYFEVIVGNQVCYAKPMSTVCMYFKQMQTRWLPYYEETLRIQRFQAVKNACLYNLTHIPYLLKRGLYFHATDVLCKAF